MEEALSDPQILARGIVHRFHAEEGLANDLGVPVLPFRMSESRAKVALPPQAVGAQTDEILSQIGYTAAEITALRKGRAIN